MGIYEDLHFPEFLQKYIEEKYKEEENIMKNLLEDFCVNIEVDLKLLESFPFTYVPSTKEPDPLQKEVKNSCDELLEVVGEYRPSNKENEPEKCPICKEKIKYLRMENYCPKCNRIIYKEKGVIKTREV